MPGRERVAGRLIRAKRHSLTVVIRLRSPARNPFGSSQVFLQLPIFEQRRRGIRQWVVSGIRRERRIDGPRQAARVLLVDTRIERVIATRAAKLPFARPGDCRHVLSAMVAPHNLGDPLATFTRPTFSRWIYRRGGALSCNDSVDFSESGDFAEPYWQDRKTEQDGHLEAPDS